MNKKISSLVSSTASQVKSGDHFGDEKNESPAGQIKIKKLKIKQQKFKDKLTSGSSVTGSVTNLTSSSELKKDLLLSSLLYSLHQTILTIQTPLPPFLIPDHFKSFLKFSLKSSSSHSLMPSFPYPSSAVAAALRAQLSGGESESPPHSDVGAARPSGSVSDEQESLSISLTLPPSFKIKEYAPIVFASLRDKVYSFSTKSYYKNSIFNGVRGPPLKMHDADFNPRVLYTTSDNLLLVKNIEGQDVESLLLLLKALHPYLVQRKSQASAINYPMVNSLLPQYMGVYRLSHPSPHHHSLSSVTSAASSSLMGSSSKVSESHSYILILRNPLSSDPTFFPIHYTYCLSAEGIRKTRIPGDTSVTSFVPSVDKNRSSTSGSTKNKDKNKGQEVPGASSVPTPDFNLMLKKEDADRLISNLEADLKFLSGHLLVNYTLLIGVHSIDLWEKELAEEEADAAAEGSEDESSLVFSITQQMQGLGKTPTEKSGDTKKTAQVSGSPPTAKKKGHQRKESLSLSIDPIKHPYAIPSPFVSAESRASSRPSLYSSEEGGVAGSDSLLASASDLDEYFGGRFVYFIGFDDLLPLSSSFSSKELNLDKSSKKDKKEKAEDKENHHLETAGAADSTGPTGSGTESKKDGEGSSVKPSGEEMGKKEAARTYSSGLLAQVKKRLKIVNV